MTGFGRIGIAVACYATAVVLPRLAGAQPCDGARQLTFREDSKTANAIFTGVVLTANETTKGSPDQALYDRRVEFRVHQVWKGPRRSKVVVWTEAADLSCGIPFEEGRMYVVFATLAKAFVTSRVHLTSPFPQARELMIQLGVPWWTNDSPLDRR